MKIISFLGSSVPSKQIQKLYLHRSKYISCLRIGPALAYKGHFNLEQTTHFWSTARLVVNKTGIRRLSELPTHRMMDGWMVGLLLWCVVAAATRGWLGGNRGALYCAEEERETSFFYYYVYVRAPVHLFFVRHRSGLFTIYTTRVHCRRRIRRGLPPQRWTIYALYSYTIPTTNSSSSTSPTKTNRLGNTKVGGLGDSWRTTGLWLVLLFRIKYSQSSWAVTNYRGLMDK